MIWINWIRYYFEMLRIYFVDFFKYKGEDLDDCCRR